MKILTEAVAAVQHHSTAAGQFNAPRSYSPLIAASRAQHPLRSNETVNFGSLSNSFNTCRTSEQQSSAQGYVQRALKTAQTLQDRKLTQKKLASLLTDADLTERAADVRRCCSKYLVKTCGRHVIERVPTYRCRHRLCPCCAHERTQTAVRRMMPRLSAFAASQPHLRAALLTLTVKSSFDPLETHYAMQRAWFKKLRRSKKWKQYVAAGIVAFDTTFDDQKGWHLHMHALVFLRDYYPQKLIAEQWKKITLGFGLVVDIRAVDELKNGVVEVLKYAMKPADVAEMGVQQVKEFEAMRRKRMFESFGELVGLKLPDDDETDGVDDGACDGEICPCCGDPLFHIFMTHDDLQRQLRGYYGGARAGPAH